VGERGRGVRGRADVTITSLLKKKRAGCGGRSLSPALKLPWPWPPLAGRLALAHANLSLSLWWPISRCSMANSSKSSARGSTPSSTWGLTMLRSTSSTTCT
jgi:hypothetical protein